MIRHQTKTEVALHVLRERIQSGQLAPGQRLHLNRLTGELGMSPTPIREALRLLQADGIVLYRPHQGIVVAEPSLDQIAEIVRLRAVLEPLAVELAVSGLTDAKLREIERHHEKLLAAVEAEHGTAVWKSNAAWHSAIYEASGSPTLLEFIRRLWDAYPWRTMWVLPGRVAQSASEHEEIMAAIRRRDAKRAAERMRSHVSSSQDSLLAHIASERPADGNRGKAAGVVEAPSRGASGAPARS